MHTNDIHGSYKYSYNASKDTGTVGFDGLAVLYSAQNSAPDLLLDAGDTFHGQSFATMSEGKSIAELMDTFYVDGYDATTPGTATEPSIAAGRFPAKARLGMPASAPANNAVANARRGSLFMAVSLVLSQNVWLNIGLST